MLLEICYRRKKLVEEAFGLARKFSYISLGSGERYVC